MGAAGVQISFAPGARGWSRGPIAPAIHKAGAVFSHAAMETPALFSVAAAEALKQAARQNPKELEVLLEDAPELDAFLMQRLLRNKLARTSEIKQLANKVVATRSKAVDAPFSKDDLVDILIVEGGHPYTHPILVQTSLSFFPDRLLALLEFKKAALLRDADKRTAFLDLLLVDGNQYEFDEYSNCLKALWERDWRLRAAAEAAQERTVDDFREALHEEGVELDTVEADACILHLGNEDEIEGVAAAYCEDLVEFQDNYIDHFEEHADGRESVFKRASRARITFLTRAFG